MRHERVDALPPANPPGPRRISITPMPRSLIVAFAPGNAMPWSVVQMTSVLRARPVSSSASSTAPTPRSSERALAVNAAMSPASRGCRAGSRAGARSARRQRPAEKNSRCVSKKPDRQEERLGGGAAEDVDRDRRDVGDARRRDLDHPVVADDVRALGDVLLADQRRVIADLAQGVDDVVGVVVQRPAPVGEAQHPVRVRVLAGEQACAGRRAGGRGAERLPEQDALLGQSLDARGGHGEAVRLHVAAGVVRVQVEDVRARHEARTVPRPLRRPRRPRARRPAIRRRRARRTSGSGRAGGTRSPCTRRRRRRRSAGPGSTSGSACSSGANGDAGDRKQDDDRHRDVQGDREGPLLHCL